MSDVARLLHGRMGETEILIAVWKDGGGEIATRAPSERTWGPPTPLSDVGGYGPGDRDGRAG